MIGINTAIYGQNGNIGIGFAMPINRAKLMLDDFRAGKPFGAPCSEHPTVYIAGDLAEALKLPSGGGLLIQEVHAARRPRAGLRSTATWYVSAISSSASAAISLRPSTETVLDDDSLERVVARKRPGDVIDLTIYRANGRSTSK